MCNLYRMQPKDWSNKWAQDAESIINLMESYEVYPDTMAPILRNTADGKRQLAHVRWGLPSSSTAIKEAAEKRAAKLRAKGKPVDMAELLKMEPDKGTTNVRNTKSSHWRRWFGVENRCIVPVTSFAEPDPEHRDREGLSYTPNAWFAVDDSKPLMFFAGLWVPQWESVRKVKDGLTKNDLFGFLTTEPNNIVGPIHKKAMPVILKTDAEIDVWLNAPWSDAMHLQRPLPDDELILLPPEAKAA